jgi:hypothetical protein
LGLGRNFAGTIGVEVFDRETGEHLKLLFRYCGIDRDDPDMGMQRRAHESDITGEEPLPVIRRKSIRKKSSVPVGAAVKVADTCCRQDSSKFG